MMISTSDIFYYDDAFFVRDDRTMVIVESKGCNDDIRYRAHNQDYIDGYKYLEVDYDDIQNFIRKIRRLREEDEARYFTDLNDLLDCIAEDRPL